MLLRSTSDGMVAITQPAHGWIAGVLARAWGSGGFAAPAPFEEVCLAAALHDIGWLDWDSTPHLDPRTGWPVVFWDVPATLHTKLWRKGVDQVRAFSTYASILVSLHGETIYDRSFDPATASPDAAAAVDAFRCQQWQYRHDAVATLAQDSRLEVYLSEAHLLMNKRFLAAIDTLSLNICWGVENNVTLKDVPMALGEYIDVTLEPDGMGGIHIHPWPFKTAELSLMAEGRLLRERSYDDDAFAAALNNAKVMAIVTTIRPR